MSRIRLVYVEQNVDGTIGGSHKCLLNLVKGLDKNLFECEVVFYEQSLIIPLFDGVCKVSILRPPLRIKNIDKFPRLQRICNAILILTDILRFSTYLIKANTDILHVNNSICVGYDTWGIVGRLLGIPIVTHERSCFNEDIMKRLAKYNTVFERVFCVSEAIRTHCLAFGVAPEKLFTTYDGIDIEEFRSRVKRPRSVVREEFGLTPEQPVVGIVGNIRRWKGQDVVARAVASIRKKIPDIHCLMIGAAGHGDALDQVYLQEVEDYIKEREMTSHVTITGFRDDIPDLLNAMDVQLHASVTPEPFGIVLLEGMSLGLPIVASNAGGPAEIIEDGVTGLLCTPGNAEEMAECILRLLSNTDLRNRFGKAALKRVERFDLHRYVVEISNHYLALIGGDERAKDIQ